MVIELDEWLTTRQAAELMGVSETYVRGRAFRGHFTPEYIDNKPFYRKRQVLEYIRSHPHLGKRRAARSEQAAGA